MKLFIVFALLSFLVNTIAQAAVVSSEESKSVTTRSGEPPPPPPPWAQITTI